MKPVRRYQVFYTDAYLSLDYAKRTGILHTKDKENLKVNRETIPVDDHNALEKELENFISCAKEAAITGISPNTKVSGEKGLAALRLAIDIENRIREYNEEYKIHFD
jgi:predicted dehydrogenase